MSRTILNNNPLFNTGNEDEQKQPEATKETKGKGRHRNDDIVSDNSKQEGLTADFTRATFILKVDTLNALKDYAYTERKSLKDAINEILDDFINDYKKKNELLKRDK